MQRVHIAQHSMSLGEERVYQAIWHAREPDGVTRESPRTRLLSLGYDRLARLVRLNEKSVRDILPKLIAKQVMEIVASEHSASRTGRTYRIFSYEEILARQRAHNLTHVAKNGRAVEFVWMLSQHLSSMDSDTPAVIINDAAVESQTVVALPSSPPLHPGAPSLTPVREALGRYGPVDDDAVTTIVRSARRIAPDATIDEIVHFIHERGRVASSARIANPIAYLIVYVPKSFAGEAFHAFRTTQHEARLAMEAESARVLAEIERERDAQRAILSDALAGDEEKHWARLFLGISGP